MMMEKMKINFALEKHVKSYGRMCLSNFSPLLCVRIKVFSTHQHNVCGDKIQVNIYIRK